MPSHQTKIQNFSEIAEVTASRNFSQGNKNREISKEIKRGERNERGGEEWENK